MQHTGWDMVSNTGTAQLEYLPMENLTLRGGYRIQYRNIDWDSGGPFAVEISNGGKHPDDTRILAHGWVASADWKPYKFLTFSGDYQGDRFDNPYTRISPQNDNLARFRVKYDTPVKSLSLMGSTLWRRRVNPDQTYTADIKDFVFSAVYQPSYVRNLSLDGSFTLEKIKTKKDITNEDFAPPLSNRIPFNSDALIWQGGANYEGIYKGLGARLFGSYAKTKKEDGQNYADGGLSFWYKTKWVTPVLTFERTYLIDKVTRPDSFDANLVTFSLRKEF